MPRPTSFTSWALDAVFNSGPATGFPTRAEPTNGEKAQGFVPGTGFLSEWANWLFYTLSVNVNYLYLVCCDPQGEHTYEVPKMRLNVYSAAQGWSFGTPEANWTEYQGSSRLSTQNADTWVVPLRGIPAGARFDEIVVRVRTNNFNRPLVGDKAKAELIRYSYNGLYDIGTPMGPANWSVVANWSAVSSSATLGEILVQLNGDSGSGPVNHTLESGYEYAVRFTAGTDAGAHVQDYLYGVGVRWVDVGPRSGG